MGVNIMASFRRRIDVTSLANHLATASADVFVSIDFDTAEVALRYHDFRSSTIIVLGVMNSESASLMASSFVP